MVSKVNSITLINSKEELKKVRSRINHKVGLIPTMGNLHKGHLSLISETALHCESIFISIFVNPLQFGDKSDLERYPKTLEEDVEKIESLNLEKNIYVFAPKSTLEIFPDKFSTQISVKDLKGKIEGEKRPGHFDGVTTVVFKLFQLIKPSIAIFGKKDYQQLAIIKKMVNDLEIPVKIIGGEIIRNEDGLALSSRNQFIQESEYQDVLTLRKTLLRLKKEFKNIESLNNDISLILESNQKWDYLTARDSQTLLEVTSSTQMIVVLAVYKSSTVRLLDNIEINI